MAMYAGLEGRGLGLNPLRGQRTHKNAIDTCKSLQKKEKKKTSCNYCRNKMNSGVLHTLGKGNQYNI